MKLLAIAAAFAWLLLTSGCDYIDARINAPSAPKMVEIESGKDSETFMACKGDIQILSTPAGYQLDFIDAAGLQHLLYGVKRVHLTEIPKTVKSTVPYPEPSLYDFDNSDGNLPRYSNGQTVHGGDTVVWKSGAQARFVIERDAKGNETGRHWEAIWIPNTACDKPT